MHAEEANIRAAHKEAYDSDTNHDDDGDDGCRRSPHHDDEEEMEEEDEEEEGIITVKEGRAHDAPKGKVGMIIKKKDEVQASRG